MTPLLKGLLFAGLILLIQRIIYIVSGFGFHKTLFDHSPGPCQKLPVIEYGSEDITTLPDGTAIISASMYGPPHSRIYTFDFNDPEKKITEIKIVDFKRADLYPHGISTWIDRKTGKVTLFLVNHKPGVEAVIIFEFDKKENSLYYKKTITDPLFTSLNDVVAVGPDSFYATNFLLFGYKYVILDKVLRLSSFTSVVFYDGEKASVVASGLSGANGINTSPDQRTVYVAASFSQQLHVYSRREDSTLEQVKVIDLYTAPDNIEVDPVTGALWVGCHPIGYKLMVKERIKGASQILHMKFDEFFNATIKEVYADNGDNFKGSSVASFYGNQMLVGSITGHLLHCDVYAY